MGITGPVKTIVSVSERECCALLADFLLFFWIEFVYLVYVLTGQDYFLSRRVNTDLHQ